MPVLEGAQAKNRIASVAAADEARQTAQLLPDRFPSRTIFLHKLCAGSRYAHDMRMARARSVFAGALLMLLGPGLPAGRPQAAPSSLELLQIADGVFVHPGAVAMMTRENEGAIANLGVIVGED